MNYTLPQFGNKAELFSYLKQNKMLLISRKKSTIKYGDGIVGEVRNVNKEDFENKSIAVTNDQLLDGTLVAKVVINTTNFMDSHDDVHFPNIWKKSLSETKYLLHLESHEMEFDAIIADGQDINAYTKNVSWSSLGYDYVGNTQALIFESTVSQKRNPFMYEQYLNGYVKNHSVGMRYVKIEMAINSEEKYYAEEKAIWDKYYPQIANKELADEKGYFFAVTEAKVIEGSAVVRGSNVATPTISITEVGQKSTSEVVNNEPPIGTQRRKQDYSKINFNIKWK